MISVGCGRNDYRNMRSERPGPLDGNSEALWLRRWVERGPVKFQRGPSPGFYQNVGEDDELAFIGVDAHFLADAHLCCLHNVGEHSRLRYCASKISRKRSGVMNNPNTVSVDLRFCLSVGKEAARPQCEVVVKPFVDCSSRKTFMPKAIRHLRVIKESHGGPLQRWV